MKGPFFLLFQTFHVKMHNKKSENRSFQTNCGGAKGIRTPDPLHAMEMRYQLRYSPVRKKERLAAASFFLWAREDLNLRPHPYQGCALTS